MSLTAAFPDMPALEAGDTPRLSGIAIPFGVPSAPAMDGRRYQFSGGPIDSAVGAIAVREHDDLTPIGVVAAAEMSETGMEVVVDLIDTSAGRDAHKEALAGVRNGFSVSFDPVLSEDSEDSDVIQIHEWRINHLGHVRRPAFGELTTAVAASMSDDHEEVAAMETTEVVEAPAPAPQLSIAPRPVRVPSLAEYGFALLNRDTARLSAYREAIGLAAGETLTTDIPGLIPEYIVGAAIDARPVDRPIFNALGPSSGPSAGSSWTHPVVTDPLADASAIAQLQPANDTLVVTDITVTWQAIKRSTLVSRESQVYSEPAIMSIIGDQLARAYARGCEVIAAATLTGATGGNTAIAIAADGSDAVAKIVGGSVVHYGQIGSPADVLFLNPADYGKVSGWTAADGRQLFPSVGALVNAGGETGGAVSFTGNIAGVRAVVSWALAAGQNYLVSSDYVRTYEGNRATINVESANFGATVGIFGTVAGKVLLPKAVTPVTIAAAAAAAAKG